MRRSEFYQSINQSTPNEFRPRSMIITIFTERNTNMLGKCLKSFSNDCLRVRSSAMSCQAAASDEEESTLSLLMAADVCVNMFRFADTASLTWIR